MVDELERLRLQRLLSDWVTGLPLYPIADLRHERMANLGMELMENGTESYVRFVKDDMERYAQAVKAAGVRQD
jgi:hypothetical protein